MADWGDTTEQDKPSREEEAAVAVTARSESDSDDELVHSLSQLMEKVRGLNKAKLDELLLTLMDECYAINAENCMLKDVCSDLKKDIRKLEHKMRSSNVKDLLCIKTLALYKDLDKLKETLSMTEEVFNTNLSKLENESLQLK